MKVFVGARPSELTADAAAPGTAITMGNFDGVHRGHRRLLDRAVACARQQGWRAWVVTFDPHPAKILAPDRAPLALASLEERLQAIAASGVHATWVLPFDHALAQMEAEDFVVQVLVSTARARHLVLGPDARFGRNRRGDAELLRRMGREHGFTLEQVAPLDYRGAAISSSRVRRAVADGRVEDAAAMLGRPFRISGEVVRGDQRGRVLGYPTANVAVSSELVLPAHGVYRATAHAEAGSDRHAAAVNIGLRPTFDGARLSIEAHLVGFEGNLYGRTLHIDLHQRLRGEMRFDSVEDLVAQLSRDVEAAARPVEAADAS